MVENSENRPEDIEPSTDESEEIIELADMTFGTSREDEEIVELTEEVLDEAMGAVSSATGEGEEGETLDLSESRGSGISEGITSAEAGLGESNASGLQEPLDLEEEETAEVEEHISQELDDFFGAEEPKKFDSPPIEIKTASVDIEPDQPAAGAISREELESTIERIIENKFLDRLEKMMSEMVENRLVEDIEQLKKTLLEAINK